MSVTCTRKGVKRPKLHIPAQKDSKDGRASIRALSCPFLSPTSTKVCGSEDVYKQEMNIYLTRTAESAIVIAMITSRLDASSYLVSYILSVIERSGLSSP